MVVKAENGRAITMSRAPKLALVQPSLPTIAMRGESVPASATLGANFVSTSQLIWVLQLAAVPLGKVFKIDGKWYCF